MRDACEGQNQRLFITSPYPRNPRVLCVTGFLPCVSEADYSRVNDLVFQLIQLDREKPGEPIVLVINGPGGSSSSLWAITNTISLLHSPVYTVANSVSSASAYLFIGGTNGHRYIYKDGSILLHSARLSRPPRKRGWQFWKQDNYGFEQSVLQKHNELLAKMILDFSDAREILSHLGDWRDENDPQKLLHGVLVLLEQDRFFTAEEAIRCGLADLIINQKELDALFS